MPRLSLLLLPGLLALAACDERPAADPGSEPQADSSLAQATPCAGVVDVDSASVEEFVYFVAVGHSNMRGRSADDPDWQGEIGPIPGVTRQWAWSGPEEARFADLGDYFGAWYGPTPTPSGRPSGPPSRAGSPSARGRGSS